MQTIDTPSKAIPTRRCPLLEIFNSKTTDLCLKNKLEHSDLDTLGINYDHGLHDYDSGGSGRWGAYD